MEVVDVKYQYPNVEHVMYNGDMKFKIEEDIVNPEPVTEITDAWLTAYWNKYYENYKDMWESDSDIDDNNDE